MYNILETPIISQNPSFYAEFLKTMENVEEQNIEGIRFVEHQLDKDMSIYIYVCEGELNDHNLKKYDLIIPKAPFAFVVEKNLKTPQALPLLKKRYDTPLYSLTINEKEKTAANFYLDINNRNGFVKALLGALKKS